MQSLFKRNGKPFYQQPMAMAIPGLLSFALSFLPLLPGFAIAPSAVPNPRQTDGTWVVDMAQLLSPSTEATLNQTITQLEATNGTEIAVVTVPDTQPSRSPKAFATKLFNTWGIGKSGVDNGLLFLVSAGERRTEIETGYGIEGVLSDAELGNILRTQVSPAFKRGDFDAGVLAGVQTIAARLETQTFSAPSPITRVSRHTGWLFNTTSLAIAAATAGIVTLFTQRLQPKDGFNSRKNSVTIEPTGRTYLEPYNLNSWRPSHFIQSLAESGTHDAWSASTSRVSKIPQKTSPFTRDSILIFQYWNQHLLNCVKPLAIGLGILSGILTLVLRAQVLFAILAAGLWLGYELWCHEQWKENGQSVSKPPSKPSSKSLKRLQQVAGHLAMVSGVSVFVLILAIALTGGIAAILLPFAPIVGFGTYAGLLRIARARPDSTAVVCQQCDRPLKRLSFLQLKLLLSKAEGVELRLGSRIYESWHCSSCEPIDTAGKANEGNGFIRDNVHLFSMDLNKQGLENCHHCKALTVETKHQVVTAATTSSTGLNKTIRQCHCCEDKSETDTRIPKKAVRQSSSSGRSGSYSSGSSYSGGGASYSSGDAGGGSFGGGSSGGGGAGDSW